MIKKEDKLTNFLPVNRKLFEHRFWTDKREYSKFEAWLDLLQSARFESTPGSVLIGYKSVAYGRGQFVASFRFLATRWGWSTKKVGNYLGFLEDEGMIKKETVKETPVTLITICKYDTYNTLSEKGKQEGNAKETAGKREGNESNIVNKEKKDNKKDKGNIPDSAEPVPVDDVPEVKVPTLKQEMEKFWLKEFHPGWTYSGIQGDHMNKLIGKIKKVLKDSDKIVSDESTLATFKSMCLQLPDWFLDKDIQVINSKFNEIIEQIKNKRNGKSTTSTKQSTYERAAAVWRT